MIQLILKPERFLQSVDAFKPLFNAAMQTAVKSASRELMGSIIQNTTAPAPGPVLFYKRTGRLAAGWGPAASFVGTSAPGSGEGDFDWIANDSMVKFVARNNVPYARAVEEVGTWITPWPTFRGGYWMVRQATAQHEQQGTLPKFVALNWNSIV